MDGPREVQLCLGATVGCCGEGFLSPCWRLWWLGVSPRPESDGGTTEASPRDIQVTFDLIDPDFSGLRISPNDVCGGRGGYSDIDFGTSVTVRDETGTLIGSGTLGRGELVGSACRFKAVIDGVTSEASFYEVEVGSRGSLVYSNDELRSRGWLVSASLGD